MPWLFTWLCNITVLPIVFVAVLTWNPRCSFSHFFPSSLALSLMCLDFLHSLRPQLHPHLHLLHALPVCLHTIQLPIFGGAALSQLRHRV